MSKDKSKKWVISAPLFYNYAGILEFLSKHFAPKSQNIKTQSRFLHALNQLLPSLHKAHLDLFLRSS